jgi:hypothetical protein
MIRLTIVTLYVVCTASPRAQGLLFNGENQLASRHILADDVAEGDGAVTEDPGDFRLAPSAITPT